MISWILAVIIIVWCLVHRFGMEGKVEGEPFGMPAGTVRALITIMIVAFPFSYLIINEEIPSLITNAIFILVAFYFQARKGGTEKLKRIVKEVKYPELFEKEEKKRKYPIYLPKYSVRIILISMLALILIINSLGPQISFVATDTLLDLFLIISLFVIGALFGAIGDNIERRNIKEQIREMENYQSLSKYEIIEKLAQQKPSWWKQKRRSFLSLAVLTAVIMSLICYTIEWDYMLLILPFYEFSLRETLLLLINVYYGYRD
jgi:hypothetical protein